MQQMTRRPANEPCLLGHPPTVPCPRSCSKPSRLPAPLRRHEAHKLRILAPGTFSGANRAMTPPPPPPSRGAEEPVRPPRRDPLAPFPTLGRCALAADVRGRRRRVRGGPRGTRAAGRGCHGAEGRGGEGGVDGCKRGATGARRACAGGCRCGAAGAEERVRRRCRCPVPGAQRLPSGPS